MLIDVHQHIWPAAFIEVLRARTTPPCLDGWTLHLAGEPPYVVDPADHEVTARARLAAADGLGLALVSLSSPLGIEYLPPAEATELLTAFHDGALALPDPFGVWASPCLSEPDPEAVEHELRRGCVGLQLPATALLDAAGWQECAPLLDVLTRLGKPLFIHPGAAPATQDTPPWWPALVPYLHQMHASWFAFRAFGRARHPRLRVCFAALGRPGPAARRAAGGPGRRTRRDRLRRLLRDVLLRDPRRGRPRPGRRHRRDRQRQRPPVRVPRHPRHRHGRRGPRPAYHQPGPPAARPHMSLADGKTERSHP